MQTIRRGAGEEVADGASDSAAAARLRSESKAGSAIEIPAACRIDRRRTTGRGGRWRFMAKDQRGGKWWARRRGLHKAPPVYTIGQPVRNILLCRIPLRRECRAVFPRRLNHKGGRCPSSSPHRLPPIVFPPSSSPHRLPPIVFPPSFCPPSFCPPSFCPESFCHFSPPPHRR
ncbi:hypothetical protein Mal15_20490 [Stieleria maiorica]|uniref:Uncharacterized protein n=1 Tax=Stieleria maiorica TaxID=2795974 RepID=A0A5B9MB95_9BACT|nr:hypothetical protein Mal15_20490 [Stieleria maiorica]